MTTVNETSKFKSAAGKANGNKNQPSTFYNIDDAGNFLTNNSQILGIIYADVELETPAEAQSNIPVTKFSVIDGTGILTVYGTDNRIVGYVVDVNEDDTNVDSWVLEEITRYTRTYTYIVTGSSDAYAGLGNARGEVPSPKKYTTRRNDTLVKIAQQLLYDGRRWRDIYKLNRTIIGSDPTVLLFGTTLKIPKR